MDTINKAFWVCYFPIGILGQVWYLIVSIPDLCTLTYFKNVHLYFFFKNHNFGQPTQTNQSLHKVWMYMKAKTKI